MPLAGRLDPNTEHPPLGKLLIALSVLLFGDNGIAWRIEPDRRPCRLGALY
jgi:hypothetical protein